MSLTARDYVQPLTTEHCGSVHYITIGDSRLLTAAGLTRSPLYLVGDAASRCGLSRVGYFIPLNGRRPLNEHPPSLNYVLFLCNAFAPRVFRTMKYVVLQVPVIRQHLLDSPTIGFTSKASRTHTKTMLFYNKIKYH